MSPFQVILIVLLAGLFVFVAQAGARRTIGRPFAVITSVILLVGILAAVLVAVENDQVGCERHDRGDVGVLRPAHVEQVGTLAEPCARDRLAAPRRRPYLFSSVHVRCPQAERTVRALVERRRFRTFSTVTSTSANFMTQFI